MVISGLLTYAFLVLAARTLGPDAYGQIGVLWGAIFIVAIVVFRPLEQTTSRAIADRLARGDEVRSVLSSVGVICAWIAASAAVMLIVAWQPITDRLFGGDSSMTVMLVTGVVVYGLQYLVRGLLGGVRWFEGYGLGLIADSTARLLVALPLIVTASRLTAATALVAAGLAGALVPLWLGFRRLTPVVRRGAGSPFRVGAAVAFASPAVLIAASDQLIVNGSPLLVLATGGAEASKAAGVVFAATMLVRAPVYVFQGLAASILPNLTHLRATSGEERFRAAVTRAVGLVVVLGSTFVVAAAVAGPAAMEIVYGSSFRAGRGPLVLLATGVALYLGASTLSQALLSIDRAGHAAIAWSAAAVLFMVVFALGSGSHLDRIALAFAAACALNFILLAAMFSGSRR